MHLTYFRCLLYSTYSRILRKLSLSN